MERVKWHWDLVKGKYCRDENDRILKYVEPRNTELFEFIDEDAQRYNKQTDEYEPCVETFYLTKIEVTHLREI